MGHIFNLIFSESAGKFLDLGCTLKQQKQQHNMTKKGPVARKCVFVVSDQVRGAKFCMGHGSSLAIIIMGRDARKPVSGIPTK